jgi:DNA damage-binding protein 1
MKASSIPELQILALALWSSAKDTFTLAILHIDHQEQIQLLSRDVHLKDTELSPELSTVLQSTVIPLNILPLTESPPILFHVPPSSEDLGGVLLIGGRDILFFDFESVNSLERKAGKRRRLEARKKSSDPTEVHKTKEKEFERESRMRDPAASVQWPWCEVTASVELLFAGIIADATCQCVHSK